MSDDRRPASPFGTDELAQVPLNDAPLLRVIAQVRWRPLSRVQLQLTPIAKRVALRLADEYPLYELQRSIQISFGPTDVEPPEMIHQLRSEDGHWQIALSSTFITVECFHYTTREDICQRLRDAVAALQETVPIARAERVGFRYVNRIEGVKDLAALDELVYTESFGRGPVPDILLSGAVPTQYVQQVQYSLPDHPEKLTGGATSLIVRQGRLPANAGYDPAIPVATTESWFLDLDASVEGRLDMTPGEMARRAKAMSEVAYRFFRWSVKDAFLERFSQAPVISDAEDLV